jgi:glycosyltransferase involved in cell wall biosynthesis
LTPPLFSILTAAYNASATVGAAVESVLAQTEPSWELIVVDDGSTDGTEATVERYGGDPRVSLIVQANHGLSGARNTALAAARGSYVALLDADDLYMPHYLAAMREALEGNPGAGFAYTDAWLLDDATGRIARRTAMADQHPPPSAPPTARDLLRELIERNFVYVSAAVRREALERVGPFDVSLPSLEDYDLWLRLAAGGFRAAHAPGVHAVYRRRAGSMSSNERRMRETEVRVLRMAAERLPGDDSLRALAERRGDAVEAHLAALSGANPARAATLRARRAAGRVKRRVLGRRLWHATPPEEIERAFPGLASR